MTRQILISVISGIILLITGLLIGKEIESYDLQERYFDVQFATENLSEITGHDVDIAFDSISIENLQRVEISLFNFNDHDVKDLKFFIELYGEQDGEVKILNETLFGYDGNPEIVHSINSVSASNKPSGIKNGYHLDIAKNGPYEAPTFRATYFIDAKDISKYKITILNDGYEDREYSYYNYSKSSQFPKGFTDHWWFWPSYVVLLLVIFLIALIIIHRIPNQKWRARYEEFMPELIIFIRKSKKEPKLEKVLDMYSELNNHYLWKRSNKLIRFINNYKPSKKLMKKKD